MDLLRLTRERDQIRRVFNRHEATADSQVDLDFLTEKMEKLTIINRAVQDILLNEENYNDQKYQEECEQCDEIQQRWLRVRTRLLTESRAEDQIKQESGFKRHNLNLPKLEIRKFDDNPKSWLAFWGQFKKIHEEKNMDAETKFQYLTQAMTEGSKARVLVESYPPTEENYPKVIQSLKERFAKDETLIEIYVRELLKLVNSKDQMTLDVLYDRIVTNLQILESLGIVKEKYECILLPMIESALPECTLLLWSKVPYKGEKSRLSNLLEFLQTEVEAERRVQLAKTEFLGSKKEVVPTAACLVAEAKQVKEQTGQPGKEGNNRTRSVRALLDSGSQRTYVKGALAQQLGLKVTGRESLSHSLFGGVKKATKTHRVFEFQFK